MRKNIEIPADTENLRIIEKVIDDMSWELNLSDEIYGNVLVATMEATNNAIVHGSKNNKEIPVKVEIELVESDLSIRVINAGPGFDFTKVPDPTAPENIEKINGRGIFLMEKLSDELNFFDEGREVELKFKL
ncbi:ATP-binding protein [Bacteroidota bacterium]